MNGGHIHDAPAGDAYHEHDRDQHGRDHMPDDHHPHAHHPHGHDSDSHGSGHHPHSHGHGDHHDHDHDGWWARARHTVSDAFGMHSHDVADQVDDVLEADARGRRALWLSLAILAVTALLQGIVVTMSGSIALLGDTLHNFADALTAVPLLVAFTLTRRPPNDRFTYGYGRAEDLAGLFVVVMIAGSSIAAGYGAVQRLLHPQQVQALGAVALAALVGFAGNELVARYRIRVGRQIGSAALVADGLHARTDGFTSLAVLLGAGGVALGWQWADPVIGLVITVAIVGVLRSAVAQVGARLMDAVSPNLVAQARSAIASVDGVVGVRTLRLRWIGHSLHAEADIATSAKVSLVTAHEIAHHAEAHLLSELPRLASATVHVSPEGAWCGPARRTPGSPEHV